MLVVELHAVPRLIGESQEWETRKDKVGASLSLAPQILERVCKLFPAYLFLLGDLSILRSPVCTVF